VNFTTELITLKTDDGIPLGGALWTPSHSAAKTAIALFAGTGAEFHQPLFIWLGEQLAAAGFTTISLNRRDHGQYFGLHRLHDAAMDQRYAIDLLTGRGAAQVLLAGHSYGTVTVPYYVAETDDQRVAGLILLAALGDMRRGSMLMLGSQDRYNAVVAEAEQAVAAGRGDETFLIPPMVAGYPPMVHSYSVFLDKRGPNAKVVPIELVKQVGKRPLFAIRDPADPFPATLPPAQERLEAANPNLTYRLLDDKPRDHNSANVHYFDGREDEVFRHLMGWIQQHGFTA
jgi:pimeloyl-ACP methyl ester carboxylesterase